MRYWICAVFLAAIMGGSPSLAADLPEVTVYKTPTCGCCGKWVEHLEANGFPVKTHVLNDLSAVKGRNGVPYQLASCHTAEVEGYAVEGHVPADVIMRLLKEKPAVAGIGVPGMPIGSPGMEYGDQKEPYKVWSFDADGELKVYAQR